MKYTKKLFLLPALSLLLTAAAPFTFKLYVITKEVYGPFTGEENIDIYLECNHDDCEVHGTLDVYNNKNDAFLFSRSVSVQYPYDTPIHFDLKGRITASGVRVELNLEGDRNYSLSKSFILYPPKRNVITPSIGNVKFDGCLFRLTKDGVVKSERYDFSATNSFISSDNANKLDVNETIFNYQPVDFRYQKAELQIIDYENIYSHVLGEGNKKCIPLKMLTKSKDISFSIESGMYVNYATMEMSSIALNGYTSTNDFYVPLGKEDALCRDEFKIVITEAGYNLSTVEIPLEYFNFMRLFGECGDSDYCIHGGIKR